MHLWEFGGQVVTQREHLICGTFLAKLSVGAFISCRYVLARPAGDRCIVVSSGGRTVSRTRNGRVLHIFPSALPNGVRGQGSNNTHEFCILDCVFHKVRMHLPV